MARSDYHIGGGMENNKKKNAMISAAANEVGISRDELSKAVHAEKDDWFDGDLDYSELLALAREIKRNGGKYKG